MLPRPTAKPRSLDDAPVDPIADESVDIAEEVNETLRRISPWMVSVLLHAAVVLFAWFLAWSVVTIELVEETGPVSLTIHTHEQTGVVPITVKRPSIDSARPRVLSRRPLPNPSPTETSLDQSEVIGPYGPSAASGDPFGKPNGRGDGFFGDSEPPGGVPAKRIAFLIDASGSLIDTMPFVVAELKSYVRKLDDSQQFTIIFFGRDRLQESPPAGLQPATDTYVKETVRWLEANKDAVLGLRGDAVAALGRALGYDPQLVYLLSDDITGEGPHAEDQQALLNAIDRQLGDRKGQVVFHTIQFVHDDPLVEQGGERTLELIAERFGGRFRFISGEELNIE